MLKKFKESVARGNVVDLAAGEPPPLPNTQDCPYCLTAIPLGAIWCAACTSEVPAG